MDDDIGERLLSHLAFLAAHRGTVTAIEGGFECCSDKARFNMTFALSPESAEAAAAGFRTLYVPSWVHAELNPQLAERYSESYSLLYMSRRILPTDEDQQPHAPELEIRRATSTAALDDFSTVQAGGFCETAEALAEFGEWMRAANHRNASSPLQRFYVGYLKGLPVTCALVLDCASIAGIYAVATLPAYRRCGFSRMALRAALSDARTRGLGISGLQVVMGSIAERVYLNLGYRTVFRMHVLEPNTRT